MRLLLVATYIGTEVIANILISTWTSHWEKHMKKNKTETTQNWQNINRKKKARLRRAKKWGPVAGKRADDTCVHRMMFAQNRGDWRKHRKHMSSYGLDRAVDVYDVGKIELPFLQWGYRAVFGTEKVSNTLLAFMLVTGHLRILTSLIECERS